MTKTKKVTKRRIRLIDATCIVCNEEISWTDDPLPPACSHHSYQSVWEAVERANKDKP